MSLVDEWINKSWKYSVLKRSDLSGYEKGGKNFKMPVAKAF